MMARPGLAWLGLALAVVLVLAIVGVGGVDGNVFDEMVDYCIVGAGCVFAIVRSAPMHTCVHVCVCMCGACFPRFHQRVRRRACVRVHRECAIVSLMLSRLRLRVAARAGSRSRWRWTERGWTTC